MQSQEDAFTILGVTATLTQEEFRKLKRKIAIKYHPDICQDLAESKKYMDALSFVSDFIKKRDSRIS